MTPNNPYNPADMIRLVAGDNFDFETIGGESAFIQSLQIVQEEQKKQGKRTQRDSFEQKSSLGEFKGMFNPFTMKPLGLVGVPDGMMNSKGKGLSKLFGGL